MRYSEDVLRRWATGLRFFRFCWPSTAPHANEGDRFLVAFRFQGEEEMLQILQSLGVHPRPFAADAGSEEAGRQRRIWRMSDFPHLAQPSFVDVDGAWTHIWVTAGADTPGTITLHVSDPDDPYYVSERAFEAARRLEARLVQHQHRIIDPPRDSPLCLCPERHPRFWENDTQ